ncbi:MAG: pyocin activator PrtN family protein [bacterium]|jgi:hypothetical protein
MKTELALLLMTDGEPVMPLRRVAKLLGIGERTAQNKVYDNSLGMPAFKLGADWVVHVEDVARHIDALRDSAKKEAESWRRS